MAPNEPLSSKVQTQEDALQGLLDYCNEQDVYISPSIAAQRYPGRGLGVYTVKPVKKGERLIHVPAKALLTSQSIPESFLSKNVRKRFTVHCALAAYLAFGTGEDVKRYQRWMATWPKLEEFTETLPVLWKDDFRQSKQTVDGQAVGGDNRARKRRKTLSDANDVPDATNGNNLSSFSRSPGIDDIWLTTPRSSLPHSHKSHFAEQAAKIRACVDTVNKHFPAVKIRDPSSHADYLRFLYMWSCVNTRCFYYLRPGQAAPEDSNEAMALCPFQDLFNHSNAKGCVTIFDKRGFFVNADKDYEAGQELFLRYGRHSNDMLWMEYGFFMDDNKDDLVKMDPVVLGSLDKINVAKLDKAGYKGDYTLKKDGACYRTVMASYVESLDGEKWGRLIRGGFDPETNATHAVLKSTAKGRIVEWIFSMRKEAEENLKVLSSMNDEEELLNSFVGEASLTEQQRRSKTLQVELAARRKDMCVRRWKQIYDTCTSAVGEVEKECPRSIANGEYGGIPRDELMQSADQFLEVTGR